jgi:hypothetical protein
LSRTAREAHTAFLGSGVNLNKSVMYANVFQLSPITFLALVDGNLMTQVLAGLINLGRPDLILSNGLFSIAGVGAWSTAMALRGSRREKLLSVLLCFVLDVVGIMFSMAGAFALVNVVSPGFIALVRIFGALSVCSVGLLIMEVRIPLGNRLPWVFVSSGVVLATLMSQLYHPAVSYVVGSVDLSSSLYGLFLTVSMGFVSIIPCAWFGETLSKHVDEKTMRFTAGLVVIGIAALIAGLQLTPFYIAAGGVAVSLILKRQQQSESSESNAAVDKILALRSQSSKETKPE